MADLRKLAKLIRYYILVSTTEAGSGHPTSSFSAVELMTALFFTGMFRADTKNPANPNNDRLIFSKGHASPLLYALYAAAGAVTEKELMGLRKPGCCLEGHPSMAWPYTEAATGSLGQGLSLGAGMAMNAKYIDKLPYRTYVLLGDSEMAEGSVWEAMELAAHYKLDNLVGIIDINRLGQTGQTLYGHNVAEFERKVGAFGWKTITVDGHDTDAVTAAYTTALATKGQPVMILAKTLKGKGVSFIEDKNGWHGKTLNKQELEAALKELGEIDRTIRGTVALPENRTPEKIQPKKTDMAAGYEKPTATRRAYGIALTRIFPDHPDMVVLDAEVSNSTFAETFRKAYPDRFFEMYIAEQNMVGTAMGMARRGKIPFVSTFAAFLTRAYDQVRMSQWSNSNIKICGSHAGVSIGQDGPSQMGLEDIAFFRTILGSVVLYPSDAVSTEKLVELAADHKGLVYLRTTRKDTAILYGADEKFVIGGCKVLKESKDDRATLVAAGITLHEALKAYDALKAKGIAVRVIDLYSVKPLDGATLRKAAKETGRIITVEDHFKEGGIGEAVAMAVTGTGAVVQQLAVTKYPGSASPEELLALEGLSSDGIVAAVLAK